MSIYLYIIIFIIVLIFNNICKIIVYKRGKKILNNSNKLKDILHDILYTENKICKKLLCTKGVGLADSITLILSLFVSIILIITKNIKLIKKSLIILIILITLRSITYNLTILPLPNKDCKLSIFGGCNDLFFSGHYIFLTLSLYLIIKKLKLNSIYKIISIILFIISFISTIICRNHYSIDIIISIVLTILMCLYFIK